MKNEKEQIIDEINILLSDLQVEIEKETKKTVKEEIEYVFAYMDDDKKLTEEQIKNFFEMYDILIIDEEPTKLHKVKGCVHEPTNESIYYFPKCKHCGKFIQGTKLKQDIERLKEIHQELEEHCNDKWELCDFHKDELHRITGKEEHDWDGNVLAHYIDGMQRAIRKMKNEKI